MTAKAATEEALGVLHADVAKRLSAAVQDEDSDPRFTAMAIKFLSDNKITMQIEVSNELGELDKHLQNKKKRFKGVNIVDFATRVAEESMG